VAIPPATAAPLVTISVRFYAGAQAAAGTAEESVALPSPATVARLAEELARRHGDAMARVLAASSYLVDEVASAPDRPLEDGALVDVLPPFAGG
jgi:sulfur-carrier protein